jgi:hypothetical protein
MAFIPSKDIPKNNVGSVVVLKKDLRAMIGTITKGSSVTIIDVGPRGYDIIDIESGEAMCECGFDIF